MRCCGLVTNWVWCQERQAYVQHRSQAGLMPGEGDTQQCAAVVAGQGASQGLMTVEKAWCMCLGFRHTQAIQTRVGLSGRRHPMRATTGTSTEPKFCPSGRALSPMSLTPHAPLRSFAPLACSPSLRAWTWPFVAERPTAACPRCAPHRGALWPRPAASANMSMQQEGMVDPEAVRTLGRGKHRRREAAGLSLRAGGCHRQKGQRMRRAMSTGPAVAVGATCPAVSWRMEWGGARARQQQTRQRQEPR